jgi:hypothetical protein
MRSTKTVCLFLFCEFIGKKILSDFNLDIAVKNQIDFIFSFFFFKHSSDIAIKYILAALESCITHDDFMRIFSILRNSCFYNGESELPFVFIDPIHGFKRDKTSLVSSCCLIQFLQFFYFVQI